jgi:hypothetical protein
LPKFEAGRWLFLIGPAVPERRVVDLAAKGGNLPNLATPNGPKNVEKEWIGAPLPGGWYINYRTV